MLWFRKSNPQRAKSCSVRMKIVNCEQNVADLEAERNAGQAREALLQVEKDQVARASGRNR